MCVCVGGGGGKGEAPFVDQYFYVSCGVCGGGEGEAPFVDQYFCVSCGVCMYSHSPPSTFDKIGALLALQRTCRY